MPGPRKNQRSSGRNKKRGHPKGWETAHPIPEDTSRFISHHLHHSRNQNLGLWLDRFVEWEDEIEKKWGWLDTELKPTQEANQRNAPMLSESKNDVNGLKEWQGDKEFLGGFITRHVEMITAKSCKLFKAKPEWRYVVGLGGASVLETGMTLHRLYGLPIIPGSALKGVARAYAETVLAKKPDDEELVKIFGNPPQTTPLQTGEIIFFDAIPCTIPKFKLDIMNPHYPNYYQNKAAPTDWQNPKPILFLTVTHTEFLFSVAARTEAGEPYLNAAIEWLKQGIAELGVGAKTAAGYGYFEEVS